MKARTVKKLISLAVLALLIPFFVVLEPLWMLEYRVSDSVFQEPGIPHPDIFIFGIDDDALEVFGPFSQWGRGLMAEAIEILNTYEDARPAVIAIDVMYTERGLDREADLALAAAAEAGGNVVMASSFRIGRDPATLSPELTVVSVQVPFDELYPHVRHGLINSIDTRDGVIRYAPLWDLFRGERFYTFPVVTAREYAEFWGMDFDEEFINRHAETYIHFTGLPGFPGDFFEGSFADIFEPWFDPSWFDGAIVMLGPYATGMMDHHPVPVGDGVAMYGVEIHANVVQQILDGNFRIRVPEWVEILVIAGLLLIGMLLGEFVDIRIVLGIFAGLVVGYYFLVLHIYNMGWVMPVLTPPVALGLVFVYQLIYGYILHVIEKSRVRNIFKKYVDPKLVDVLIESGEADSDEVGRKRQIAVLFVDVRGFTPMTERLKDKPEVIVEVLNEYLELTSSAVFGNGGSVDKFIGDATMALFNGFVPLQDYVYAAAKAAWDMVQRAEEVNKKIKEQHGIEIGFGVGLHCGEAIVGNLGPSFRKDYTAIGDTVNTAARLESNAKHSEVLISSEVLEILKDRVEVVPKGAIPLKGKAEPMEVYALTGLRNQKSEVRGQIISSI